MERLAKIKKGAPMRAEMEQEVKTYKRNLALQEKAEAQFLRNQWRRARLEDQELRAAAARSTGKRKTAGVKVKVCRGSNPGHHPARCHSATSSKTCTILCAEY